MNRFLQIYLLVNLLLGIRIALLLNSSSYMDFGLSLFGFLLLSIAAYALIGQLWCSIVWPKAVGCVVGYSDGKFVVSYKTRQGTTVVATLYNFSQSWSVEERRPVGAPIKIAYNPRSPNIITEPTVGTCVLFGVVFVPMFLLQVAVALRLI